MGQKIKNYSREDASMIYDDDSPTEGDRFIPQRPSSPKDMLTKLELFTTGKSAEEEERRKN